MNINLLNTLLEEDGEDDDGSIEFVIGEPVYYQNKTLHPLHYVCPPETSSKQRIAGDEKCITKGSQKPHHEGKTIT